MDGFLSSGVEIEESRHDQQHESFHEDEETQYERPVIEKRIGKSDVSPDHEPADQPDQLTLSIPHNLLFPEQT